MRTPWPKPLPPLSGVRVSNCNLSSSSSAIKIENLFQDDHGDVTDVAVSNVNIYRSNRGIGVWQRVAGPSGGFMGRFSFTNVSIETKYMDSTNWWGSGEAIVVTSVPSNPSQMATGLPGIHGVVFENVVARAEGGCLFSSRGQAQTSPRAIEGLVLRNVSLTIARDGDDPWTHNQLDFRPVDGGGGAPNTVPAPVAGLVFEGVFSASVEGGSSVSFEGQPQPYWAGAGGVGTCVQGNASVASDFTCKLAAAAIKGAAVTNVSIALDGATAFHRYDGHGGLSAGASSRLLFDYPEPQRSQILDYLFLPSFGAGMHHLKVEISGDGQSTDGTEPSHSHVRGDLSCDRGYELWLLSEARKRNPQIATYALAWTLPGFLNNGSYYGPETITYFIDFLRCSRQRGAGNIDTLGLWNEDVQPNQDWLIELREALDGADFAATKISIMDNAYVNNDEVAWARANDTYRAAIGVAGLHDPCSYDYVPMPWAEELGWKLWSSEDFSRDVSSWSDSQNYWVKALSQHYVVMNITATISWSLIWSAYSNLICRDSGLMRARTPHSGYYEVSPTIWLHAHWGQFVQPGWRFLHVPGGGSGFLNVEGAPLHGGTFVSLVPENDLSALTVIVETSADRSCMQRNLSHFSLRFTTRGGLPGPGTVLYVWSSTQSSLFVQLAPLTIDDSSSFSIEVAPDSVTTVTTVSTGNHGSFPDSPVPADLPWYLASTAE